MEAILEDLFRQHRDAERMLVDLAAATELVRKQSAHAVIDELSRLRHEIQGEVLSHFREEELALFPVLGRHAESSTGPIAVMMEEHARFRQLELQFEEALAALESGLEDGWADRLCDAADEIGRLLPPHIQKEEGILFPLAESVLEDSEWAQVHQLWKDAVAAALET